MLQKGSSGAKARSTARALPRGQKDSKPLRTNARDLPRDLLTGLDKVKKTDVSPEVWTQSS